MEASLVEYVDAEHGIVVRHRLRRFEHVAVFHICLCKVCVLVGSVNGGAAKFGRSAALPTPDVLMYTSQPRLVHIVISNRGAYVCFHFPRPPLLR